MAGLSFIKPYDETFLGGGFKVPLPTPRCVGKLAQGGAPLDYIHFSLVLHADRKAAVYVANNVDTTQIRSVSDFDDSRWEFDPRAPGLQTGEEVYGGTPYDRGHLAMRQHVAWGETREEAIAASSASHYYTNAAPQHENFNQDEWLRLENWLASAAPAHEGRLCIFTGPLYTKGDARVRGVRIPAAFWKVGVMRDGKVGGDDLLVAAFVVKQTETRGDWEGNVVENLKIHQVGLRELGPAAGLDFGPLTALDDYDWRSVRFRDRRRMGWIPISGPEDIVFHGDRRRAAGGRAARTLGSAGAAQASADMAKAPSCGCADRAAPAGRSDRAAGGDLARQLLRLEGLVASLLDVVSIAEGPGSTEARAAALRSARERAGRILGGVPASPTDYKDCVCLGNGSGWFCTGVLVRPTVVLTAAHCVDEGITRVLVGAPSLSMAFLGEVISVKKVFRHPAYDPNEIPWHDLAVVVLSRPATLATPRAIATAAEVAEASDVNLVGFGYDHPTLERGFGTKRILKDMDRFPHEQLAAADAALLARHEEHNGWDHAAELYVGEVGLGRDTCRGDSGGPVYVYVDEADNVTVEKVAALTSRASDAAANAEACGDGGVYTQIAPYAAWIAEVTGDASFVADASSLALTAAGGRPFIAAVMANPAGTDQGAEWVEVGNAGADVAALDDLVLKDRANRSMALHGTVAPGTRKRFVLPSAGGPQLANDGGTVRIERGGSVVHEVAYGRAKSGEAQEFPAPAAPVTPITPVTPVTPLNPNRWDADPC